MGRIFVGFFACLMLFFLSTPLIAQKTFFQPTPAPEVAVLAGKRIIVPERFKTFTLEKTGLKSFLSALPAETGVANRKQSPVISLPMPDGSMARFNVWKSPVMDPVLAAKYPEIQTFAGQGIDDPYATVRFDYNPYFGFSAQVLSVKGNVFIDPYSKGSDIDHYQSYYANDYKKYVSWNCIVPENSITTGIPGIANRLLAGPCRGTELYTYRLALACTGEYAVAVCSPAAPTVAATLAAMTTTINRINSVYEKELSVRVILIANTDLLINLDAVNDGYTNNNGTTMLGENQNKTDIIIGTTNYDIGHVFSTGGGGIAGVGVVCNATNKARGVTGLPNPTGDAFDIDFVAHEMGHQFGANHSYNGTDGLCGSQRNTATAYEPGSGTTIMAYAGTCASDDIQPNSSPYFHAISFDEISTFLQAGGGSCKAVINTGNTLPVINALPNNNANIPTGTPFTLSGSATDANGDNLTYSWEEWDLGAAGGWNTGPATANAPIFKSRTPKITGERTFPDMSLIVANYNLVLQDELGNIMNGNKGELLPQVGRTMKFRLTVRDNRAGGGGVVSSGNGCQSAGDFQVNVIDGTGPFLVTSPNTTGISYVGGSSQTITWNVAGTSAAPINCTNVKISLSTDGGLTYPTVISASTPNDGTETLIIPNIATTTARIKIEATGNIFFDISNVNFTITPAPTGFEFTTPPAQDVLCSGPASASVTLGTTVTGGFNTPITLSASNVPPGATISFSPDPLTPGNSTTVTLSGTSTLSNGSYIITITGTAGATIRTRDITFNVLTGTGPAITGQPQPQTACAGTNTSFSVSSPGALSYQWQLSTNGGGSFSNISGATAATLNVNAVTITQNGNQYRVIVTGQCNTTTSNAALLTVQTLPSVSTPPQSISRCIGSDAVFSVIATGSNITYQWQVSTDGGASFNPIGGATASSYTAVGVTTAMNNYQYRVVVTGTCTPSAISAAATLTVISPVIVTTQPQDVTICETGNVSFTAAGSGAAVLYQWQVSTDGGTTYTNINGATTATLNVNAVTATMNNNRYRALLSNATCTNPATTSGAVLTVNARPTVTLSATPLTELYPGQSTTINAAIVPSAAGFTISWFRNDIQIPNITGTSYSLDVTGVGNYKARIVNATTGCNNESAVLAITAKASERLFVFPSPNDGQFTVSYYNSSGINTKQSISVFDSNGQLVYSAQRNITSQYTLHAIDLRGKARGIYVVVVSDANGKKLKQEKVVIY